MELAFIAPVASPTGGQSALARHGNGGVCVPARRPRVAMTASGRKGEWFSPDEGPSKDHGEEAKPEVYHKGSERKWKGDDMPFDVRVISPPPRLLGRFHLHPRTGRGDVIEMGEASYVVKRVRSHFVWGTGGGGQAGPKLTKKTVETVSIARKSIEMSLEKTFRDS